MDRYKEAGVDVTAGYDLVNKIKPLVASTKRPGYVGNIGSFGGLFDLDKLNLKHPMLVSGTDGVGTKLLIAQKMHVHNTIGIDCVAMCVNDVLAQGASPLFFLDYIATGHNDPKVLSQVVAGIAAGCRQANASLIGGETAEMPGMYSPNEYDLAGFTVGVVERDAMLTTEIPKAGDVLFGLASSGLHSNGYSLVRKILFENNDFKLSDKLPEFNGESLGQVLLTPTRIYVKAILPLIKQKLVHGIAHITGGGLYENVPRMFGDDLQAGINLNSWKVPKIYDFLQKVGKLSIEDCLHTFNMGLGMVLAVDKNNAKLVKKQLQASHEQVFEIGSLQKRNMDQEKIKLVGKL